MNRQSDVNELLSEAEELFSQIERAYSEAETNEDIVRVARPKVKSCLEHLRSTLDYIAADLSEDTKSINTPRNVYFPYGKDKKIYHKSLTKNLPDLDGKYLPILESIQPHKCGDKWLLHLCKITNFNKHTELQEQNRKNSANSTTKIGNIIHMDSNSSVTIGRLVVDGVLANPTGPLVLTGNKSISEIEDELAISIPIERKYEWVKFLLKGTQLDIRFLLKKAHQEITQLADAIYSAEPQTNQKHT